MANYHFPNGFTKEERERCNQVPGSYSVFNLKDLEDRGLDISFLKELSDNLPSGCSIAGGAVESIFRGEKPKDYDVYFTDISSYRYLIKKILSAQKDSFWGQYKPNIEESILLKPQDEIEKLKIRFIDLTAKDKPKLQLITTMIYDSTEHILETFDFTAAMGAIEIADGDPEDSSSPKLHSVILHPMMPIDVARKRLVLHRMTFPASTLRRMIKYTHKGYYACPGSIQKIAEAVADILAKDPTANGPMYID